MLSADGDRKGCLWMKHIGYVIVKQSPICLSKSAPIDQIQSINQIPDLLLL